MISQKEMDALVRNKAWIPSAGDETAATMTLRERFRRTMRFEKVDRIPHFEFGYWKETLPNWRRQGLPGEVNDEPAAYGYFGIEDWATAPVHVGLCPGFQEETISEDEERRIFSDGEGVIREINKVGDPSIPHFVEFPIRKREDFEAFRERLDGSSPARYPDNWDDLACAYRERDFPLGIHIGSMIGKIRDWTGFEGVALMTYDDPGFLEEMVETMCRCVLTTIERALGDVEFDLAMGWEDICFNSGPIIHPAFFDRVIRPRYERITERVRAHGCFVCGTDCDGNVMPIIESFLKGGINCMFPVEIRGGTDPRALRDTYGERILFMGGVDKHALGAGPRAIDRELERLRPLVEEGGFIPHVDHRCPANVSLADYVYYLKQKREVLGVGGRDPVDA